MNQASYMSKRNKKKKNYAKYNELSYKSESKKGKEDIYYDEDGAGDSSEYLK